MELPLHHAVLSNQPEVLNLLLSQGTPINAVDKDGCSALHVAVNERHVQCMRILLQYHCDVNLRNSCGDTALHDAIGKDALDVIDALCACDRVDFTLRNKRGFNILHQAAFKGNAHAMKRLVARARHLVDVKKEDGFAALHIATLNGYREVAAILLSQRGGCAKVNLRNNQWQTPLHLATLQGHWSLVELLVHHNADVGSTDEDGDTVLHFAIAKSPNQQTVVPTPESSRDSPLIYAIWQNLVRQGAKTELALACFLVSVDRSCKLLEIRNNKNETPLDLLESSQRAAAKLLRSYKYRSHSTQLEVENNPSTSYVEPPMCQIDNVSQSGELRGMKNIAGSDDAAKCRNSSEIITNTKQENRIDPSSGFLIDCTHCGHTVGKIFSTHIFLDAQVATGEASLVNPRWYNPKDKSINISLEESSNREKEFDKNLKELKTKIANLEEAILCSICMAHSRSVAFLCGHSACQRCATLLKTCHICRKTIRKKIFLYL